jgi:hypothetical protein
MNEEMNAGLGPIEDPDFVTDELARSTYFFLREMERYFLLDEDTGEYSSKHISAWAHNLAEQFPQGIKDFVEFEGE